MVPYRSTGEVAAGVAVSRQALQATVALARSRGAIALIVVPQLWPETSAERALRRRVLDEPGLPYIQVTVDPSWHLARDHHPDPRADRAVAEAVAGYIAARSGSVSTPADAHLGACCPQQRD
jgi:DNA-binding transcriptional regulator LsrR (DeoR family)